MNMKSRLKTIERIFSDRHGNHAALPDCVEAGACRKQILFEGRVQRVGFRLTISRQANKMGLTGWAENLDDGRVLVELQGHPTQVSSIIERIRGIRRFKILNATTMDIPCKNNEKGFTIVRK